MPTATELWGRALYNLGPLTTTFTAPASCTATPVPIGLANGVNPARGAIAMEACGRAPSGGCLPKGSVLDREYTSSLSVSTPSLPTFFYHSPGNACPSGWATVGSIVKDASGSIVTSSWARESGETRNIIKFATETGPVTLAEFIMYDETVLGHVLGPQETGIACCPSEFTPMQSGGCYSTATPEAYTATTACQEMLAWPVDEMDQGGELRPYSTDTLYVLEKTITAVFISVPLTGTVTITDINDYIYFEDPPYGPLPQEPYVAFYKTDMVLLVSTASAADGDGGGGGRGGDDGDDGNAADHTNGSVSGKIAMVVGAWMLAMVVGGALVVPL